MTVSIPTSLMGWLHSTERSHYQKRCIVLDEATGIGAGLAGEVSYEYESCRHPCRRRGCTFEDSLPSRPAPAEAWPSLGRIYRERLQGAVNLLSSNAAVGSAVYVSLVWLTFNQYGSGLISRLKHEQNDNTDRPQTVLIKNVHKDKRTMWCFLKQGKEK